MNDSIAVPPWARAGLDALAHGYGHSTEVGESDRRLALLGFDVAIEGTITGYLRDGPGVADISELATAARAPRARFWPKATWLAFHADHHRLAFPHSAEDLNQVRSARNDVQHGGDWWVPSVNVIESGRAIAVDVVRCLVSIDLATTYPSLHPQRRPRSRVLYCREWVEVETPPSSRRTIAQAAWRLAQRIDPEGEGVHYRHLADRMIHAGVVGTAGDRSRSVYDSMNRAHDLFRRVPGAAGVWRWVKPSKRNARTGLTGTALADICFQILTERDPHSTGLSYVRDILPAVLERGFEIRGIDIGATVNAAIRRDPRFVRVEGRPGVYRRR